ncbi:MAG: iron export ABC transporter permease subunit FetB [Actinomycetota bacterium]
MSVVAQTSSDAAQIGVWGLAASAILIVVAVVISLWRALGLERSIVWAALRALAQLVIVGFALQLVVGDDSPLVWSFVWLVVMLCFASWTTAQRAKEVPRVFPLAFVSFLASMLVTLGVLFGFGVYELEGRTIVPLAGIAIGNSLAATVLLSRQLMSAATEQRRVIEGRLALGLTARDAFQPHLRSSLRTALVPQVESTKAVGIVALPGAMTGLILAGVDPLDAVLVQISVMYLVLGAVATTATVMSIGISRELFTPAQQLRRLEHT